MNTNCLEGMQCPKCGSFGPFHIRAECTSLVHDSGIEDKWDVEWSDENACWCVDCRHEGTVKSFSRKGR
jgi:hypothetical protein